MFLSLAIIAVVLSIALILPYDLVQTADAAKASGVKIKKYGPDTKHKVCGDRLCTPTDLTKNKVTKSPTSTDLSKDQVTKGLTSTNKVQWIFN